MLESAAVRRWIEIVKLPVVAVNLGDQKRSGFRLSRPLLKLNSNHAWRCWSLSISTNAGPKLPAINLIENRHSRDIFLLLMQLDAKINDKGASTTFCVDRFTNVDILGSHHFGSQILVAFLAAEIN